MESLVLADTALLATFSWGAVSAFGWPLVGLGVGLAAAIAAWVLLSKRVRARELDLTAKLTAMRERADVAEEQMRAERRRPELADEGRAQALEAMSGCLRDLVAVGSRKELGESLGRALSRCLEAGQWMVFLDLDRDGRGFVLCASGGEHEKPWSIGAVATDQTGRLGLALRRKATLTREDFEAEPPLVLERLNRTEPVGFRVEIAAPILVGESVVGIATVGLPTLPTADARAITVCLVEAASAAVRMLDARDMAKRLENRDELTGLGNRNWFNAQAAELIYRTRDRHVPAALAMFGIDRLREHSGRHGPGETGRLLHSLAEAVRPLTRAGDLLARWSDEEFVVFLPHTDEQVGRDFVDRLRRLVAAVKLPGASEQPTGAFTISAGLALFPTNGLQFEELIESAYRSLSRARDSGGDRCYREGAAEGVRAALHVATSVPHAPLAHAVVPSAERIVGVVRAPRTLGSPNEAECGDFEDLT